MVFFGRFKERFGTITETRKGYQYIWKIPHFAKYRDEVLDSDNVTSYIGAQFHFHITITEKREVGVYLHYKRPPVPKYSYYLSVETNNASENSYGDGIYTLPPGVNANRCSRQFTAHSVPPDTERCGHWNVLNSEQIDRLLKGTNGTLLLVFEFDDDTIITQKKGNELEVTWEIPMFRHRMPRPFTSKGFEFNGSIYVLRVDQKTIDPQQMLISTSVVDNDSKNNVRGSVPGGEILPIKDDYIFFIFSRNHQMPPHSLSVSAKGSNMQDIISKTENLEGQTVNFLQVKMDDAAKKVADGATLCVKLSMFKVLNPLDVLNFGLSANAGGMCPNQELVEPTKKDAPEKTSVKGSFYAVMQDDL